MRLLIALGLTLLVGATWAQHSSFFNIESATDLLALPSDQLIDSDIEHEAVETIVDTSNTFQNSNEPLATVFDLPFGARLPGYERIQYAYGYQIPEKSKAQAAQSVSFPANVLLTHTPAETRKEVISSSPLHEDSTTLESRASTTEVVVVTQAPNHSSPKTSIPKDQTISWLNSTYFPQLLNLNLSPPENEHEFTAKLTEQSPESYHPPEAKLKTETALPSLETGYLPPERDFLIESPQAPPLPPADSYLPPNLGTVSNVSESKSEGLTLKSGHLLDTTEHKSDSALLETSYLPPKPDPVSKIEKHELDFPLPESSYLPPNPDPILEFEDKSEPPLPDISYLPPNTDLVAKITESVTKPPQTKISNNDEPLILIPILSPPMKPAEEFEIQRNEGLTVLPLNAAPAGVIGEYENQPVTFSSDRKIPTPAGVVGEYENQPITFSSDRKIPTPAGVVGEYENQPITFSSDRKIPTPAGVVGEIEEGPIKFSAERKNSPPTGAILELEDSPITFSREIKHTPPVGVIEEYENLPIKFSSETESPVPYAITGEVKPGKIKPVRKPVDISPYAVVPETRDAVIRAHAKPPTARPVGVISEITENAIEAHSYQQPVVVAAIPKDNAACTQNHECSEEEICMDGMCINACIIAIGLCIGNAVCHARRHIPGCVCPDMFTAVTIRGSEQDQYDCMPMMMMMGGSRSNRIAQGWATSGQRYPRPLASQNVNAFSLPPIGILTFPFAPLVPVAPLAVFPERSVSQGRITTSNIRQTSFSGDPCSPSPCGPNTRCETSQRGIPLCRCLSDFVPDGNTINGCKPQCTVDDDCPDDYRCRATKCVRVCVQGACGTNAECEARNHRPVCECPSNYRGDPHITCTRERPEVKVAPPAPPLDPCAPNPCGLNADCRTRGDRPVCTCPLGYEGDPLSNCRRGECIENNDCPGHRVCQRLRCIDPCQEGICGSGAECTVRNHQPICSCPRGFTGDPFVTCRRFDPQELCSPSPCGRNTNCKVRNERAVCSCIDNYIGNPLTECRPECVTDSECPHNLACRNNICVNPCREACGEGAYCDVRNNRAVCSCPEFYQGDPYSRCFAECTAHDDCPGYQACFQLRCVDPCEGACGSSANCKVENHKPICSCPKGYTGHPFESCRPFTREDLCNPNPCGTQADCTPGFDSSGNDRPVCTCPVGFIGNPLISCERGDCQDHSQCRDQEACYAYTCQNPCYTDVGSVCGENAQCNVKNHQPVCSCPPGYDGNPLTECRIGRGGSFVAGRIRK